MLSGPEPMASFTTPLRVSSKRWGSVPRFYIRCERDRAISPKLQTLMEAASPCLHVSSLVSDHSPFYSAPEKLADTLLLIAERDVRIGRRGPRGHRQPRRDGGTGNHGASHGVAITNPAWGRITPDWRAPDCRVHWSTGMQAREFGQWSVTIGGHASGGGLAGGRGLPWHLHGLVPRLRPHSGACARELAGLGIAGPVRPQLSRLSEIGSRQGCDPSPAAQRFVGNPHAGRPVDRLDDELASAGHCRFHFVACGQQTSRMDHRLLHLSGQQKRLKTVLLIAKEFSSAGPATGSESHMPVSARARRYSRRPIGSTISSWTGTHQPGLRSFESSLATIASPATTGGGMVCQTGGCPTCRSRRWSAT